MLPKVTQGPGIVGSYKHGNEPSGSIERECLLTMGGLYLIDMNSALWRSS